MECNMEEAFRAKEIAEKKIESDDFAGARRLIMKAQQLYAGLENVPQMLAVCEVHYVAQRKIDGNDTDWYGILQVEPTADDTSIKKQYKKFALLLHPDKNKFCGAEAAFKLVGDAMAVLSNQKKRMLHDIKRKATINGKSSRFQSGPSNGHFGPSNGHFGMKQTNKQTQSGIHVRMQTQSGIHVKVQTQSGIPVRVQTQCEGNVTQPTSATQQQQDFFKQGIRVRVQTQCEGNATQPTAATHQQDFSKQGASSKGKGSAIPSNPAETPSSTVPVASKGTATPSSSVSEAGKGSPTPSGPIPVASKGSPTPSSPIPMAGKGSAIPSNPIAVADNMSNIKMVISIIIKMVIRTIIMVMGISTLVTLNGFFYAIFKRIL